MCIRDRSNGTFRNNQNDTSSHLAIVETNDWTNQNYNINVKHSFTQNSMWSLDGDILHFSNDGFVSSFTTKVPITDTFAFHGLHGDGIASLYVEKMIIEDMVGFKGSTADGSASALLQKQMITDDIAFKGHIGRGDHHFELKKPDCSSEVLLWTGYTSQAWENPDNWQCGVMPNVSSDCLLYTS